MSHMLIAANSTDRSAEFRWSPGKRHTPTGTEILEDQGTFTPVRSLRKPAGGQGTWRK